MGSEVTNLVDAHSQLRERLIRDVVRRVGAPKGDLKLLVPLGQPPLRAPQVPPPWGAVLHHGFASDQ